MTRVPAAIPVIRNRICGIASSTTWSENQITFKNKPATSTNELAKTTIVNTTPQWYEWDVTQYVKQQVTLGKKTITLVLQNNANSDPFVKFDSKEAGANGPQRRYSYQESGS